MGSPYLPKRLCNSCMIFSNERNKRSHDLNDSSSREEALTEPISETNFTLNARLDELPDLMINLVRIVADLNFSLSRLYANIQLFYQLLQLHQIEKQQFC